MNFKLFFSFSLFPTLKSFSFYVSLSIVEITCLSLPVFKMTAYKMNRLMFKPTSSYLVSTDLN
jgi:hypothetical protein